MKSKNFATSLPGREIAFLCLDMGYHLAERPSELTRNQINFLITAWNMRIEEAEMERMFAQVREETKRM